MGVMSNFGNFCKKLVSAVAATALLTVAVVATLAAIPVGAMTMGMGTVALGLLAAATLEGAKHFAEKAYAPNESSNSSEYSKAAKFEQEPTFSNDDREQPSTPRMGS